MRHLLNRFINAVTLCLNADSLIMLLPDGTRCEGGDLADVLTLMQYPILLVINPVQFLQAHGRLEHLYLTAWQQEILHQLTESSYVLRSVLFLPDLMGEGKGVEHATFVNFNNQQHLFISKESVVLWTHFEDKTNQIQQLKEIGVYLRRYRVEFNIEQAKDNLLSSVLIDPDLQTKARRKVTHNLQSNHFPLINKIVEKQRQSNPYLTMILGLLSLVCGSVIAGFCFLWLSVQAFINHNPWDLKTPTETLTPGEREKLLQFKNFLSFQTKYPALSLSPLQSLFKKFAGKIVATDLVWQQGKWTIAFVVNPEFVAEMPQIYQWCTENLNSGKMIESETTAHQYTLQFE